MSGPARASQRPRPQQQLPEWTNPLRERRRHAETLSRYPPFRSPPREFWREHAASLILASAFLASAFHHPIQSSPPTVEDLRALPRCAAVTAPERLRILIQIRRASRLAVSAATA